MATTIVTKSGSGAPTASDLVAGELAVDLTNKRLYTENSGGTVLEVGSNPYNFTANHDGSAKLATTATGIDVTGTVTADSLATDDDVSGTSTLGRYSSEFAYSLVRPSATATGIEIRTNAGNALAHFLNDGTTTLHHNGSAKLTTLSTGIDVTGTVTADGLTVKNPNVSGEQTILKIENAASTGTIGKITFNQTDDRMGISNEASGSLSFDTATLERLNIASNGDISFYEDTGTTPKFFWDASAESLTVPTLTTTGAATAQKISISGIDGTATVVGAAYAGGGRDSLLSQFGSAFGDGARYDDGSYPTWEGGVAGGYFKGGDSGANGGGGVGIFAKGGAGNAGEGGAGIYAAGGSGSVGTAWAGYFDGPTYVNDDLTITGGVYLGGTGAANLLEDYEEGTFTPILLASAVNPSVTYTYQAGTYTKVGNVVNVYISLSTSNFSGGSGNLWVAGLPFAASQDCGGGAPMFYKVNSFTETAPFVNSGASYVVFLGRDNTDTSTAWSVIQTSAWTAANPTLTQFQMTYFTS